MFQLKVVLEQINLAGKRLRRSRAVVIAKNNLSPVFSWSAAHRLASVWLIFALLAGNFSAILEQFAKEQSYRLTQESASLLGHNTNLADKLTFDKKTDAYRFNADAVDSANKNLSSSSPSASADPATGGVPDAVKAQLAMQQNVGASDKKDKQLYGVDLPVNPNKGITVADTNTKLSFTMTPNFPLNDARIVNNRVVYPVIGTDQQAVYSLKNNGLKEDIVLQSSPSTNGTLEYSYTLKLPDTLVAKLMPDGAIGIYSADPALFGQITASSPDDQKLIDNARKTAEKNYLVFAMPAPVIKQAGLDRAATSATSQFTLKGDQLGVSITGLNNLNYPVSVDPSVVVTSTADFQLGNNEDNNIDFSTAGQINRGGLTGGTTGAWGSTGSYTPAGVAREGHSSVVYNGFVYIMGGIVSSGSCDSGYQSCTDVLYAPLNSDGSVGWASGSGPTGCTSGANHWCATTSFSSVGAGGRAFHSSVTYNSYVYVIGGYHSLNNNNCDVAVNLLCSTVLYAHINSDGTVGTWSATSSFAAVGPARERQTSVVYSGYVYIMGGDHSGTANTSCSSSSSQYCSDVLYTQINVDGTLGTWASASNFNSINSYGRAGHSAAVYNGYTYVLGGIDGHTGAILSDVILAPINSNGTLGTWQSVSDFSGAGPAREYHTSVVYNGYIYVIGGYNATTPTTCPNSPAYRCYDTLYAPIYANGTLGSWTATSNFSLVGAGGRSEHTSVVYNGYVYAIGGRSNNTNILTEVIYAPLVQSGGVGPFKTTTSLTGNAVYAAATVAYNGFVYNIGGNWGTSSALTNVNYATLNADGTLSSWTSTNDLTGVGSGARYSHTAVAYNGYIYVIGGYAGGAGDFSDVLYTLVCTGSNSGVGGCSSTAGSLGTWQASTNNLSSFGGISQHASVAYNGYLYAIGGYLNSNISSSVLYSAINANGTLGAWASTTGFSSAGVARSQSASVVYNGYLYVIGGRNASAADLSDVLYAQLGSSGTIPSTGAGSWATTTSLGSTLKRDGHTAVVYNGYVYLMGGYNGTSFLSDVLYAPLLSGGGVGSWVSVADFSNVGVGRELHTSVISNGYIYVLGGWNGSTRQSNVLYAQISTVGAGSISAFNGTANIPAGLYAHTSVAYNGYIYVIGGYTGSAINTTEYVGTITASTGAVTWATAGGGTGLTARFGHTAFASNGFLYVTGGCTAGSPASCTTRTNTTQYATLTGTTIGTWSTGGALPANTWAAAGATYNNSFAYVIGGCGNNQYCTNTTTNIYVGTISSTGGVTWTTATPGIDATFGSAAVVSGNYLYIIGGCLASAASTGMTTCIVGGGYSQFYVQYLSLNNTTGAPTFTGIATSLPTASFGMSAFVNNGYLYVMGGLSVDTGYQNTVSMALINTNGTLGPWVTSAQTINGIGRQYLQSFAYGGFAYVTGGILATGTVTNATQLATINNGGSGTAGTWATNGSGFSGAGPARSGHTAVAYNGFVYVMGGYHSTSNTACNFTASNYCSDVLYASISASGAVGTWTVTTTFSPTGTLARYDHSSAVYNGYLYIMGGSNASGNLSDTLYAPINSNGTVGTWVSNATSFSTARLMHSSVAYNGYLYVMGGQHTPADTACSASSSNACSDVQYALICTGSNSGSGGCGSTPGSVGTWSATTSFSGGGVPRWLQSSVVYNGYLYVLGGQDNVGNNLADVLYAPINSGGTIGSWAATTGFSVGRQAPGLAISNGYIYVMGGYSSSGALADVQYAPLNSNGTLGTWSLTSSFTGVGSGARFDGGATFAYAGYAYIVGGASATTNFSDVLYAPLNVQARVGRYSRLFDLGSSQNLTSLVYNGTLLGGGAVNVSWASAASSTFGAVTTTNNVAPGSTFALSGSGRYVWIELTVDDSAAGTFADSVAGQSFITDITLNYAASYGNPATRLRGGASFSNGVLQRLNP